LVLNVPMQIRPFSIALALGIAPVLDAQQASSPDASATRSTVAPPPTIQAVSAERIAIDGRLDEATWQRGNAANEFTQVEPRDGAPPSQRTSVRVAVDAGDLYIAARLYDTNPDAIVARLGRRDSGTNSDAFTVSIDSYHDHRTSFQFGVNAAGVKFDGITSNDAQDADGSWDPVWDVATRIDSEGWTVEMRIPLSQLRFASDSVSTWGVNFERYILRTGETVRWAWVPNSETGFASRFGHLDALGDLAQAKRNRLEIMPYTVVQGDFDTAADKANPFFDGRSGGVQLGADFKYGVSNAVTLTGTINPDFGQVEADAAEVNLTVFETYFNERRPFFVEGANLFRFGAGSSGTIFGSPQLFYSRRIGRPPSAGAPASAEFSQVPEVTQILGAAKMSGRIAGWSVGLLDAVTAKEKARFRLAGEGSDENVVEPLTNYSVLSLRRDLQGGRTGIGMMGTSVIRDIDEPALSFLRETAHTGGVDFYHRFGRNQYSISGTMSGSRITGDSISIAAAQRSSARYFQRPDQDYMEYDPSARSLSGYAVSASGGKVAGSWLIGSDFTATSPGFEINDVGFQQSADRVFVGGRLQRRWLTGVGPFRYAQTYLNASRTYNYDRTLVGAGYFTGVYGQLRNLWSANVDVVLNPSFQSDRLTRGGPLLYIPPQWQVSAQVTSDSRKRATAYIYGSMRENESGGHAEVAGLGVTFRPSSAITMSVDPSYSNTHTKGGYLFAYADPTAAATYGRRHLMSDLDQTTFDVTLRSDLALSPVMSLQLYAQPFTSAVDYTVFKAFQRPGTLDFMEYGANGSTLVHDAANRSYRVDADGPGASPEVAFGDPDFRLRSLRANLVLRWEYRPGSTVYLAWAHGRSMITESPEFDVGSDFSDLLRDDQRNRIVLKVSYWFTS
jgi:hypothetical protein